MLMWSLLTLVSAAPPDLWAANVKVADAVASPSGGDLLIARRGTLEVRSPTDGTVRATASLCRAPKAIGFVSDSTLMVVCETKAQTVSWPDLKVSDLKQWTGRAEKGGFGPNVFAVGFNDGKMSVHRAPNWAGVESMTFSDIETLSFDPQGERLLLANDDGKPVRLYPVAGEPQVLTATGDLALFTPDGESIFGILKYFTVGIFKPGDSPTSTFKCGSWINDAAFLSPTRVLAGGSDGLVVYQKGTTKPVEVWEKGSRWNHLALGEGWNCAANWTELRCWGQGSTVASQVPDPTPGTAAASGVTSSGSGTATAAPAATAAKATPMAFSLTSRRGNVVKMQITGGEVPKVGHSGTLSKRVVKQLGRMSMTAWVNIASVKVTNVTGGTVTLTIEEEQSIVMVNGQKVDHFKPGSQLRLE
ncbi:MAG: hypothetical protein AB8H79_05850 [Myxococcota bacterium]